MCLQIVGSVRKIHMLGMRMNEVPEIMWHFQGLWIWGTEQAESDAGGQIMGRRGKQIQ